jgi:putative spermidine/putrescine transport system permease protein
MVKRRNKLSNILMILFTLFVIMPFFPLLIWSFTKQWPWPLLLPENWSMDSWLYLISDSGMALHSLANSLIVAVITLLLNLALGIPAARSLAQNEFVGKKTIFIILLSPLFIPYTVSIIGIHQLSIHFDFINEYVSVALAHLLVTLPYFIATIWFQFRLMGTKLQEAGAILGANSWRIFLWIELPLLLPSMFLASLLVMIISLSQYLPTWIMSGGSLLTLPLVIFPFASSGNSSIVSAYSLLFFTPVLCLLIVYLILLKLNDKRRAGKHET